MPFTRKDDTTVVDDETGQSFFLPSLASVGVPEEAQPGPTEQALDLDSLAARTRDYQAPQVPLESEREIQMEPDRLAPLPLGATPQHGMDYVAGQVPSPRKPTPAEVKQAQVAERNNLLANDPVEFAARGGVVAGDDSGRAEMARMQAGQAKLKEDAYLAEQEAQRVQRAQQAYKDRIMAGHVEETAAEFARKSAQIDAAARRMYAQRQAKIEELERRQIEPGRAWSNMSGFTKAMWILGMLSASQTRNSSQNMGMLMQAMDNVIQRDIAAQKADLQNDWGALEEMTKLDGDIQKLNLKGLADWSVQRELRYKALEKQIDAKIAAIGNPAAERAGLLKAKAMIQAEIIKGQEEMQKQIQGEAESAKSRAHQIYLKRLDHKLGMEMEKFKDDLAVKKAQREKADQLGELGVEIGGDTGLRGEYTDPQTGQTVTFGGTSGNKTIVRARSRQDAVEAEMKITAANRTAGLLKRMNKELGKMSEFDLATRRFTPQFRADAKELAELIAKINNRVITDKDATSASSQLMGFDITDDSVINGVLGVAKTKGDTVKGAKQVLASRIASLEANVTNQVLPHLEPTARRNFRFGFEAQEVVREPSTATETTNEAITKTAGPGVDVSDLQVTRRQPLATGLADKLVALKGPAGEAVEGQYIEERDRGKLPKISPKEEQLVEDFRERIKNMESRGVMALSQAMGRRLDKENVSDEARFRLVMEARLALREARDLERKIQGDALFDTGSRLEPGRALKAMTGETGETDTPKLKDGRPATTENYMDALADYLGSDEWKAARTEFGLRGLED